ncbi:cysteine-rich and transmembrane domain-containing protein 1-like [Phascolarctos cinereus]|uniref:Cysteine-rich and transmembrane domain-containing protein 1 n=1 Tax=Phascolarctos cinereus TaxID=38626 RepID=A0A6P5J2N7_PHACI|nr:cysteine-rich and transmembrane domain-containing protein 1-like [Phascolarctos cinereus]
MNYGNPPPYSASSPTAPYPPHLQQPGGSQTYPSAGSYPAGPPGPYPPPNAGYPHQGYPQYGWQGATAHGPTRVYVVEEQRKSNALQSNCLTACWTALCCCCLLDALDD